MTSALSGATCAFGAVAAGQKAVNEKKNKGEEQKLAHNILPAARMLALFGRAGANFRTSHLCQHVSGAARSRRSNSFLRCTPQR